MKKYLLIIILPLLLGCFSKPRVTILAQNFHPVEKKIVFLSQEADTPGFRIALAKKGFTVPKYPFTTAINTENTENTSYTKIYNETKARYGIGIVDSNSRINYCRPHFTFEIVDLKENQVIAYIYHDGSRCGYGPDSEELFFSKFAEQIVDIWKNYYSPIEVEK